MPSTIHKAEHSNLTAIPIPAASSPNNREVVVNIVFGLFAVLFAMITLWQGHRWWQTMSQQNPLAPRRDDRNDLELSAVPTSSSTAMDISRSSTIYIPEGGSVSDRDRAE